VAYARCEGAVTGVHAARATDMRASKSAAGMTDSRAAALAPSASMAAASNTVAAVTAAASTTTATTGKSVRCHGSGSDRDGRDHYDCSVQLNIPHADLPSGFELTYR
jgi:hypothetical protein